MTDLSLIRFAYTPEGTFGRLPMPDGMTLFTVERPWLNNAPNVSCIPCGDYTCAPKRYNRGGYDAVQVLDVPGRSYILFHIGNDVRHSQGCILVNSDHAYSQHGMYGVNSRTAFKLFMEFYGGRTFSLHVSNYVGGYYV